MKNMPKQHRHSEETWESGELGTSEAFVRKVSPKRAKNIDDDLGLQMISIRLQKKLVMQLKELADDDGIGYQPFIRQLLTRGVREIIIAHNSKKPRQAHR
jgi:hypothetical protein